MSGHLISRDDAWQLYDKPRMAAIGIEVKQAPVLINDPL